MLLGQHQNPINEVPLTCRHVSLTLLVVKEVLIDPHLPLIVTHCHHVLSRPENSEDVDESIIPNHHLLQKVNYLRQG